MAGDGSLAGDGSVANLHVYEVENSDGKSPKYIPKKSQKIDISGVYMCIYVRERGIPERINQSSLGAMMARDPCTTSSCRVVVSAASPSAIVRWDGISGAWGEKCGGVDPRAATVWVFPHQTGARCTRGLVPPALQDDSSNRYVSRKTVFLFKRRGAFRRAFFWDFSFGTV